MDEHPFHQLCVKPAGYPELIYSKARLTAPRKKVNGELKEISWDEAFSVIVDKLARIKEQYGAQSMVPFAGNGLACRSIPKIVRRFGEAYGTPNFITGGWTCFGARVMAFKLTLGSYPNADYSEDNRCMVLWGTDPQASSAPERHDMSVSNRRGAKLIVIDPVATPLAKKADLHAQVRPGTDCALALGLLHVIIGEKLYNKAFVEKWTVGFDKLVERVKAYPPEKVEAITWVPAETIQNIARMYAQNHPASVSVGVSLDHSSNGIQAMRSIAALMAICGNLEISGGNVTYPGVALKNLNLPERVVKEVPIGTDFPLFVELRKHQTGTRLTETILKEKPYPIKAVLVIGGNPLVNWPNSSKVKKAFEKLDFLLVQDLFMTDTARMADIVLPAASDLETEDLRATYFDHNSLPLLVKSNKVIEPIGKCMEDWKIWAEVGRRMGYAEFFPWNTSDELLKEMLEPSNITLDLLNENPGGIIYSEKKLQYYLNDGFKTPSKKVEIYSETMDKLGYDPIPTFHEPLESPGSRPDLVQDYPFVFMAGSRTKGYTHSRFREIESLKRLYPNPLIEINTETAESLGIKKGDLVRVASPRGHVKANVKLTQNVPPKLIVLLSGWSNETGANANCLTDNEAVDPVSGFPEYRALLCNVAKA
jgi:anaerobic selenocysteine-containing dehydrogenase